MMRYFRRDSDPALGLPLVGTFPASVSVISYATRLLILAVLGWAAGPVRIGVRTHCQGLGSQATLCSRFTACQLRPSGHSLHPTMRTLFSQRALPSKMEACTAPL